MHPTGYIQVSSKQVRGVVVQSEILSAKRERAQDSSQHFAMHDRLSMKWHWRNEHRNSILITRHYPDQATVANCAIHWIEIYPVDRIIYLSNNRGQGSETSAVWNFSAGCHFMENPMVALRNVCCFFRLPKRQGFCFSSLVL